MTEQNGDQQGMRDLIIEQCLEMVWLDYTWNRLSTFKEFKGMTYVEYLKTLSNKKLLAQYHWLKAMENRLD